MRCGHCGQRLTAAMVAMGQCPHCGNILDATEDLSPMRMEIRVQGEPPYAQPAALPEPQSYQAAPTSIPAPPMMPQPDRGTPRSAVLLENQHTSPAHESPPLAQEPPQPLFNSTQAPSRPVVDAEPMALPPQYVRSRNPFLGIGLVLMALLALGSVLVIAGQNNIGPLTNFLHPGSAPSAMATTAPTQQPTSAPTATTVPPTATPLPPTATPLPTVPPPPTGYSTFMSTDGSFGFNYPSTWHSNPNPPANGVTIDTFSAPFATNEAVQVDESNTPIDPQNIETYLKNYSASSNGTNVTITAAASTYQIGTNSWMHAEASYLTSDGTHKVFGLAINNGTNGYLFFYDAPASSYQVGSGSAFDAMVKSFTFLKG